MRVTQQTYAIDFKLELENSFYSTLQKTFN